MLKAKSTTFPRCTQGDGCLWWKHSARSVQVVVQALPRRHRLRRPVHRRKLLIHCWNDRNGTRLLSRLAHHLHVHEILRLWLVHHCCATHHFLLKKLLLLLLLLHLGKLLLLLQRSLICKDGRINVTVRLSSATFDDARFAVALTTHLHAKTVTSTLEVGIVVCTTLRSPCHSNKAPSIQFPREGGVLGLLVEVPGQDLLFKRFLFVDHETASVWEPRDHVGILFVVKNLQQLYVVGTKQNELATSHDSK